MLSKSPFSSTLNSWAIDFFLLLLIIGFFYALGLGSHPLFTPDEGRYSEIAREMVVTHDFITPRLNGVAFLDKPILYYWLQASAIKCFGVTEWAVRLWPMLFGIFGTLVVYLTGRIIFNRQTALLSALILATSPLYYGAAHYANLDLEVAVLISNSLLCFLAAMQNAVLRFKKPLLFLAYLFASLAFLTKGLIGVVFPIMIIGLWIITLNKWAVLRQIYLVWGMVLFVIVTLPWYFLVQKANPEFLHFFFVTQQVSRFLTTENFNNKTPMWFYLPIIAAGLFPWSMFIIQALIQKIKQTWEDRHFYANELFLLLWVFIVFVFFSIPKSKTIGYILPIIPALALLTGHYWSLLWNKTKRKGLYAGIVAYILVSCVITAVIFLQPWFKNIDVVSGLNFYLYIMALDFFLVAWLLFIAVIKRASAKKIFMWLLLGSMVFLLTLSGSAKILNQKSIKPLALEIKSLIGPQDKVVTFYRYYQDLPMYLEQRVMIVADWQATDIGTKDNWVRELWYGMPFQDTHKWLINEKQFWPQWRSATRLFVLMDDDYYSQHQAQFGGVKPLDVFHHTVLLVNH